MPDVTLYTWFLYFFIYAFIGWSAEVAYAAVILNKFVNRGFLNGPICPIYGFGVCCVVICLTPLKTMPLLLYVGAVLLTSALEFVTGWLLERFFSQKWWDYSDRKFNIKGYVCFTFSLFWGVGCMAVIYLVHPLVAALVDKIPNILGHTILFFFLLVFAVDFIGTLTGVLRLSRTIRLVREMDEKLHRFSDIIGENISDVVIAAVESGKKGEAKFTAFRDKYGEKIRELGDFAELREKYEKIMRGAHSISAKRIIVAFPKLKRNELIKSVTDRVESFFKSRYSGYSEKKKGEGDVSQKNTLEDNPLSPVTIEKAAKSILNDHENMPVDDNDAETSPCDNEEDCGEDSVKKEN